MHISHYTSPFTYVHAHTHTQGVGGRSTGSDPRCPCLMMYCGLLYCLPLPLSICLCLAHHSSLMEEGTPTTRTPSADRAGALSTSSSPPPALHPIHLCIPLSVSPALLQTQPPCSQAPSLEVAGAPHPSTSVSPLKSASSQQPGGEGGDSINQGLNVPPALAPDSHPPASVHKAFYNQTNITSPPTWLNLVHTISPSFRPPCCFGTH